MHLPPHKTVKTTFLPHAEINPALLKMGPRPCRGCRAKLQAAVVPVEAELRWKLSLKKLEASA